MPQALLSSAARAPPTERVHRGFEQRGGLDTFYGFRGRKTRVPQKQKHGFVVVRTGGLSDQDVTNMVEFTDYCEGAACGPRSPRRGERQSRESTSEFQPGGVWVGHPPYPHPKAHPQGLLLLS